MAKAAQPPEGMQARVLAATYRTRQLPPVPGARDPVSTAGRGCRGCSPAS